jgi:hypothetical protein
MFSGQRLHAALTLVASIAVLASACGDGPTAPAVGTLRLSVQTSGGDLDIDGYDLVVDSAQPRYVSTSGIATQPDGSQTVGMVIDGLAPGIHSVSLTGVANNCSVTDTNPRSVAIARGETVNLAFGVACVPTGVEITTHTTGLDQPPLFNVRVDDVLRPMPVSGSQIVTRLEAGRPHVIALETTTGNCTVQGGTQTVTVSTRTIVPVHFEISCAPVLRLEKIAYVVDTIVGAKPVRMIGLVKPDGSGAAAATTGDSPSWSPDGKKIVLTEASCDDYAAYYGTSCDGGLVVFDPEIGTRLALTSASGAFGPAWSPTGDAIAFTRCCVYADRNSIFVIAPDGSLLKQVAVSQVGVVSSPGWSPDGKRLAFICSVGSTSNLCVIDVTGAGFMQFKIADASVGEGRPAWSPDGKNIAFTLYPHGTPRPAIVLLDVASGTVTRVTDGSEPAWSRDGSKLVFNGVGVTGLYTINVDGSSVATITTRAYSAPAWRP